MTVAFVAGLVAPGAAAWVGSDACAGCHEQQHAAWRGSHHDLAMQRPTPDTVLGDFDNATFTYNGITTRFHTRNDRYYVDTDGESGTVETFEVKYVFGVYPLQQYLLPLSRGRLQALTIAWDARPAAQGGQRWYHLYPDEAIAHDDPLHWTGPYLNWNTRCAECHSTDVQKNYDATSRSYTTTFEEIDVGCESCHGPGDTHVARAREGTLDTGSGFPTAFAQRGAWHLAPNASVARRSEPLTDNAQIDNCGRCHSRRGTLGDYHYGADLLDTHRLSLPRSPLYHHDGQILDEVYVYGSFIQSKMHQAGVVCSNCHEPHSLALRAPGNGVCTQCHVSDRYDTPQHHHHAASSAGALCANCHMPEQTYMGVDPRRDHSLRIPRPDLSVVMGTPNACNQCHQTKSADWALDALRQWGVTFRDTNHHRGRLFARLEQGDTSVVPSLATIANAPDQPPIWRATALEALGDTGGREALQSATALVYDDDALLRLSAVRALAFLPLDQRYRVLRPLIDDPVTAVRMAVANSLAGVPLAQLPESERPPLRALFDEYLAIQQSHADMPGVQLQLGLFHAAAQDIEAAEAAYREALRINRQLVPAYLNLADLMRATGRDPDARKLLGQAQKAVPENGDILHVLGLLETRAGNTDTALDYLARAAALETNGTRHRFVYAVALHDLGQPEAAVTQLRQLLRATPGDTQVLGALVNYLRGMGRPEEAQRYADRLRNIAPAQRQAVPAR